MLKTTRRYMRPARQAYHLGEGRVLKTMCGAETVESVAYHLGEGRVLKTLVSYQIKSYRAYHLGEGRVLKTECQRLS